MSLARFLTLAALLTCAAVICGCTASSRQAPSQPERERFWPREALVFRHKVSIEIPGRPFLGTVDGVMRLDGEARTVHVVALGGMGVTLFDMTVTPDAARTNFILPGLARAPRIEEQIALCVRSVWLDSLSLAKGDPSREPEIVRETRRGATLEHVFKSGMLTASRVIEGSEMWSAVFAEPFTPGGRWPRSMTFQHEKLGYKVHIRLVDMPAQASEKK